MGDTVIPTRQTPPANNAIVNHQHLIPFLINILFLIIQMNS